ncbi:hypothetical protein [Providencia huashanensis]|uniref:hypothetical protein n=1 Tax=Providencia huashanensis TaxID=3037798 RepID=UPI002AFFB9D0|nr:hypothetical protein [Providencia sp. 23021821]
MSSTSMSDSDFQAELARISPEMSKMSERQRLEYTLFHAKQARLVVMTGGQSYNIAGQSLTRIEPRYLDALIADLEKQLYRPNGLRFGTFSFARSNRRRY